MLTGKPGRVSSEEICKYRLPLQPILCYCLRISGLERLMYPQRCWPRVTPVTAFIVYFMVDAASAAGAAAAVDTPVVLAQAGSVDGTVGRQNKAASGIDEPRQGRSAKANQRRKGERASRKERTPRQAQGGLSGPWRWNATCPLIGNINGVASISERAGSFSGVLRQTNLWDQGKISGGRVRGASVSFLMRHPVDPTGKIMNFAGTLSRSGGAPRIQASGNSLVGPCSLNATKI